MTSAFIAKQFELSHDAAHRNLAGITHEESIIQPSPGGNSLNWVLGHLVATRNLVMQTLGEPVVWSNEEAAPYERGAKPARDGSYARRLEDLVAALDRSQPVVMARVRTLSADDLARPSRMGTVGDFLTMLCFHEAYHVGQFGLLRRLLGKDGAIA
jgi:uncharacterized damage-inducible protein DinB